MYCARGLSQAPWRVWNSVPRLHHREPHFTESIGTAILCKQYSCPIVAYCTMRISPHSRGAMNMLKTPYLFEGVITSCAHCMAMEELATGGKSVTVLMYQGMCMQEPRCTKQLSEPPAIPTTSGLFFAVLSRDFSRRYRPLTHRSSATTFTHCLKNCATLVGPLATAPS